LDNGARSSSKEINEGAVGAQAERALQNLRRALAAVGQSADDLVFGGHPNNRCGGAD
jgi:enamine deaminase RidA (YjgF/YER057c/UK114 family)